MKSSENCPQAGSRFHHHQELSPRRMRFPADGSKRLRIQNQTGRVDRPFHAFSHFSVAQPGTTFAPRRRCSGDGSPGSGIRRLSSGDGSRSSRSRSPGSGDGSLSSVSRSLSSGEACGSLANARQNLQFASRLPVNIITTNDLQN